MDVSIVIRARNEADSIGKVLDAVAEQDFDGQVETVVVDSSSTDGTPEIAQKHGARVISITTEEFTWGYALNRGASETTGTYIVNLSAHAVPAHPKWLHHLIEPFKTGAKTIAGVFGRQLAVDHGDPFEAVELDLWFPDGDTAINSGYFSNSNGALRRDVWQGFPFDEKILSNEDNIWASQVVKNGYQTYYQPQSTVFHNHDLDVAHKESTSSIYMRWYWRSYTSPYFNPNYRGAEFRQVLRSFLDFCRHDARYLKKAGLTGQMYKIPIYELIRQHASWKGARDYLRGYYPQCDTWRQCFLAPSPPFLLKILGVLL